MKPHLLSTLAASLLVLSLVGMTGPAMTSDAPAPLAGFDTADALELGTPIGGETILDSLKTANWVICNETTCECYECTSTGNCQPVPPPRWCNPR